MEWLTVCWNNTSKYVVLIVKSVLIEQDNLKMCLIFYNKSRDRYREMNVGSLNQDA